MTRIYYTATCPYCSRKYNFDPAQPHRCRQQHYTRRAPTVKQLNYVQQLCGELDQRAVGDVIIKLKMMVSP